MQFIKISDEQYFAVDGDRTFTLVMETVANWETEELESVWKVKGGTERNELHGVFMGEVLYNVYVGCRSEDEKRVLQEFAKVEA